MRYIITPPSSTWLANQAIESDHVIGQADEIIADSDGPARMLLQRLFGPALPRVIVVEEHIATLRRSVELEARL